MSASERKLSVILVLVAVAAAGILLVGCGGGGNENPPPTDHWLLIMETSAHQPETIFVYDTDKDCMTAGSYRLFVDPVKYIGYSCKEV